MAINVTAYNEIIQSLENTATLVAVSKLKPSSDIELMYNLGQRNFGENYVQELVNKYDQLPKDILWHFIGHLQSNKVKYIAPFVHLIHGVDSLKLLQEINKQAIKNNRVIPCLLQVHIAQEETKFGFDDAELANINWEEINKLSGVSIVGLMGMASFSENENKVRNEFKHLKNVFLKLQATHSNLQIISMGMSGDYLMAIEEGSNMIRIGSLLFGNR